MVEANGLALDEKDCIEVFSLSNPRIEFDRKLRQRIQKEFGRAASALANRLAGGGKRKVLKNKALAKVLTDAILLQDYLVFSRINPRTHSEAFYARNLIFKLCSKEEAEANDYAFGEQAWILAPKKKLSLPFEVVTHGICKLVECYIPLGKDLKISLPLNPKQLAKSPQAKNIVVALQQGAINIGRRSEALKTGEAVEDMSEVINFRGGRIGKCNHDRARTRLGRRILPRASGANS
jgi:hypothetical protein